jgi:hypothetical protein
MLGAAMAVVVDRKTRLTYEDYLQFPEDGRRHEIIDGAHYASAAPFVSHQRCPELTDGVFRSAGEHAERIAVACARKPDGDALVIELGEVW